MCIMIVSGVLKLFMWFGLDECLEGRRKHASVRGPGLGSPDLTVKGRVDFWGETIVARLGQVHGAQAQGSRCEIRAEQQGQMGRMHHGGRHRDFNIRDNGLCQMADGAAVGPPFPLQKTMGSYSGLTLNICSSTEGVSTNPTGWDQCAVSAVSPAE